MLPIGDTRFMNENGEQACKVIYENYNPSSGIAPLKKGRHTIGYAIGIREKESFTAAFGVDKEPFMRLFGLLHETGHALIHASKPTPDNPYSECVADAYAALSCFQRFGNDAAELLSLVSWSRVLKSVVSDTKHLTTPVLDKIIADSAGEDFSKLSQADIIERAESYAKDWTPRAPVLAATRPDFVQNGPVNFRQLAEKCFSPASNDFSFYLGERLVRPYLKDQDGITYEGTKVWFPDEYRREMAATIRERNGGQSMQERFNAAMTQPEAAPSPESPKLVARLGKNNPQ